MIFLIKNKLKIHTIALGIIYLLMGCQTATQRLQKENPDKVFLQMEAPIASTQKTHRILSFFSEETCRTSSLEGKELLVCPKESLPFLKALSEDGVLENTGDRFFVAMAPNSVERILKSDSIVQSFQTGKIQEALDGLKKEDYATGKEVLILDGVIRSKIETNTQELVRILEEMIESESNERSLERKFISKYSSFYLSQEDFSKTARRFLDEFGVDKDTECRVQTKEPNSPAFVMEGFEEPVEGRLNCAPKFDKRVSVVVSGNRYLNVGSALENQEVISVIGESEFSYNVNSLSQNREDNQVGYSLSPWYKQTIDRLSASGQEFRFQVRLSESAYAFETTPRSFSPEYDRWESEFPISGEEIGSIKNGKIASTLKSNGKFTMGGENSDGPYDLMFGHPNGKFADGIWSSFTAVKIDDEVYRLDGFTHEVIEKGEERIETSAMISDTGIRVHTIWEKPRGVKDALNLGYRVVNTGNSTKKVGIRVFLDTWAGYSDGVPFALPAHSGNKDRIITEEVSFNPHTSAIWETTDFLSSGDVFLQNQLVGGDLTPPDEVQLVNWGSAIGELWDYSVSESRSVTGDSAAALIWQPKEIPSKKEKLIRTRFLSIQRDKEYSFQPESDFSSTGTLVVNKKFDNCSTLSLKFSQEEGTPFTRGGKSEVTYELNPEGKSNIQIPLTLHGMGETNLNIQETCQGMTRNIRLPVSLPGEDYSIQVPLAEKDTSVPVQFTSKSAGRKLEARLLDSTTEEVLTKTTLKEEKKGNLFIYTGELKTSKEGGYMIEYIDLDEPVDSATSKTTTATSSSTVSTGSNQIASQPRQVRPKEVDLPKGFARLTFKNGDVKEGKILVDGVEEIQIQLGNATEKYTKRDLKSLRYGR
jgi:hypothetical protein